MSGVIAILHKSNLYGHWHNNIIFYQCFFRLFIKIYWAINHFGPDISTTNGWVAMKFGSGPKHKSRVIFRHANTTTCLIISLKQQQGNKA